MVALLVPMLAYSVWVVHRTGPATTGGAPSDAQAAAAIGDAPRAPSRPGRPVLAPVAEPFHERTCCAFGMDLRTQLAEMDVPFFEISNIAAPDDLGRHIYDLTEIPSTVERNGLVYTCRGGWIDTAHVRENADLTFFLARRIAPSIELGTTLHQHGQGADTTIVVAPVPRAIVEREGAMELASVIAAWIAYRVAVWHEISTWYGYQTVAGFSEQLSAFSVEDLYSDVLGIRLGTAQLDDERISTVQDYQQAMPRLLQATLARLGARPLEESEAIMVALDRHWWSSARRLPDVHLVMRRAFPPDDGEIHPWLVQDAFAPQHAPPIVGSACPRTAPRPIALVDRVGDVDVRTWVDIEWHLGAWADATFPFHDASSRVVRERDLDALVIETRARMEQVLGAGFDSPGG